MVASRANTSLPRAPAAWGDVARALATKAAMSSEVDGLASGNGPALPDAAFCVEATSPEDWGLVGSADIGARNNCSNLMWAGFRQRSMRGGWAALFQRPTTLRSA